MPARRFLWVIAILTMLVVAAALAYRLFGDRMLRAALVPTVVFTPPAAAGPDYAQLRNWVAHPGLPSDPARWTPDGFAAAPRPGVAVFFVPPTAVFDRNRWNAALDDAATNDRLELFVRGQATVFNGVAAVWVPRYRQATFGAFLTDKPEAQRAIDAAYGDVKAAFTAFLAAQPPTRPIILAAHSQGSLHLLRLLRESIASDPALKARIVAIYAPGWPISVEADLPALGFPACTSPDQTGCVLSWQSFATDGDFTAIRTAFDDQPGLTGAPRRGTTILCSNPLTGVAAAAVAPPAGNLGSLVPSADFSGGTLVAKGIGARCLPSGVLDIGPAPGGFTRYILPGGNFHVYDYALFWANLRADAERRVAAFGVPGGVPGTISGTVSGNVPG